MKRYFIESRSTGIFYRHQEEGRLTGLRHAIAGKIEERSDGRTEQRT